MPPSPSSPPTIRDVAAAAGVSNAAVSLAYHQPHRLRPATRDAILHAARALGYRPNLAASLLRSRNPRANSLTRNISLAFITAEQTLKTQRGKTISQVAAQTRAEELGYGFQRFDLALEPPPKNLISILRARGVAGVIFGPNYQPHLLEGFDWPAFAGVCLAGYPAPSGFHRIRSDPFLQVLLAWEELRRRGYRRIGATLFHHQPWLDDDRQRVGAFLAAQKADPHAEIIPALIGSPVDPPSIQRWFRQHRPDAVIDFICGMTDQLRHLQVRVPEECALVTLWDPGLPPGQVAQVREDPDAIGIAAVGMLDQLLRHHEIGPHLAPQDVRIPPRWQDGASVRPLAAPSASPKVQSSRRTSRAKPPSRAQAQHPHPTPSSRRG